MKYRLYVDEVGNPDLGSSRDPNHRYLSLTGVVLGLDYVRDTVFPTIESLKKEYFDSHPDEPIVLHRKELVNRRAPFERLRDRVVEESFNRDLLALIDALDFTAITIVIDKLEHLDRYHVWHADPYHYGLQVLVERFVLWLRDQSGVGDVMSESRSGRENQRLMDSFTRVYEAGTDYVSRQLFQEHLTSRQLKVRPKRVNISGLQLADLIAHPSFKATLARRRNEALPEGFGGKIAEILEAKKYYRSRNGRIEGWGRKWLP